MALLPSQVVQFSYQEEQASQTIIGEKIDTSITPAAMANRQAIKCDDEETLCSIWLKLVIGYYRTDFADIGTQYKAAGIPAWNDGCGAAEWGNLYGYLVAVKENGVIIATGEQAWPAVLERIDAALAIYDDIAIWRKKR